MRPIRKLLILLVIVALAAAAPLHAAGPAVRARHGMVASTSEIASRVGVDLLRAGGNAVDAAVATAFALAVVHPQAGNIGGGGFLLLRQADGKVYFLDFREKAPAAATRDMYLDAQGNVIEGLSLLGPKSIAVPGSVAGLTHVHKKFGRLPLKRVMAPAIRLARRGFPLSYTDAVDFRDPDLAKFPETRRIFQRDGRYYQAGEVFRQPELAKTLERIAADPAGFYRGALARDIAAALQREGALITERDLKSYDVQERQPVHGRYRGYEIVSAPPPSSGGIALIEALNILEGYDLNALGAYSADSTHLRAEALRRAFFDRAEFMGDPDFAALPVPKLLDKKYAAAWRESLHPEQASRSDALRRPAAAFAGLDRSARLRAPAEPEHTTHFSVVDARGNAVAVTTTLNDSFGSKVMVLGFLLNDEMDDFTSKAGVANMFGLLQSPANAIAPGKRPLSAMAPTIVLKDGRLVLVAGSPGGPRIISTLLGVLTGMVDFGMGLEEAVSAPRLHHQWMPDVLRLEYNAVSPEVRQALAARGHRVEEGYVSSGRWWPDWGDVHAISVDPRTGERLGASDPRNGGKAVGY